MGFKKDCRYFMYKYYNGSKIPSESMARCMRGDFPALIGDYYCEICRLYPVEQKLKEIGDRLNKIMDEMFKWGGHPECGCVYEVGEWMKKIKKILEAK